MHIIVYIIDELTKQTILNVLKCFQFPVLDNPSTKRARNVGDVDHVKTARQNGRDYQMCMSYGVLSNWTLYGSTWGIL